MTVAADNPSFIQIPGNGTAVSFAFPFKIFQASDLVVGFITSTGYGQQTSGFSVPTQGVDANGGGNVVFTTAPPSGTTVDIRSVTPKIQNTEFANLGSFLPEAHTEAFDRLTRTVQDLYRLAYTFGVHGPDQEGTAWTALPPASQRKNTALMFDSNGLPTIGTPVTQSLTKSLVQQYSTTIYAEVYGAVGDGATDSTSGLISAIAALGPGSVLELAPNGVYMVHVNAAHTLLFSGKSNFSIRGNGATIRAFANDPCASNDEIIYFTGCSDFTVENLVIDGNRANRTPTPATTHNLTITGGCQRAKLRNVRSINSCMDGIFVVYGAQATQSTYPSDILLENCHGENSYRNGCSLDGCSLVTIKGGRYINSNGTSPQNGIDVEPDPGTTFGNTDIVIDDVEVTGNTGDGLELTGPGTSGAQNTRVTVRGLKGNGNGSSFITVFTVQDLQIDGVFCGQHSAASRGALLYFGTGGVATDVGAFNLMFAPQVSQPAGNYLIFDTGVVSGRLVIDGVRCNNFSCQGILLSSPGSLKNVALSNSTVTSQTILIEGVGIDSRNITVDTCGGKAFYASAPTELDGFTFINAGSVTASAQFDTGATGSIVRNGTVRQTTSIPVGAVGIYFNSIPAVVQNFKAVSAGTDYTASNIFNFVGGTTGLTCTGCFPNPFSATVSLTPGNVTSGSFYATTVAISGVAFGDFIQVAPPGAMQGMTYSAAVDSAGNVKFAISNTTGATEAAPSGNYKFWAEKRP